MKIEIGESLIYSWLRHVEKCSLVQLNWKVSPVWSQDVQGRDEMHGLFSELKSLDFGIKESVGFDQFVKQAEVDAVGLSNDGSKSHFVDVAFHEGGLNYGGSAETAKRVAKKAIRSAIISKIFFPASKAEVVFASPVCGRSFEGPLTDKFAELNKFSNAFNIHFTHVLNGNFEQKILNPVLSLSKSVADTSELFLRSNQLLQLFAKQKL